MNLHHVESLVHLCSRKGLSWSFYAVLTQEAVDPIPIVWSFTVVSVHVRIQSRFSSASFLPSGNLLGLRKEQCVLLLWANL